jgi:hypothetical protein
MAEADSTPRPSRGRRRSDLQKLLLAGLVLAAVVRGCTWPVTYFYVGPMLGLLDLVLPTVTAILIIEAVLTGLAALATVFVSAGLAYDPGRYRRAANVLGWIFAADTVLYLVPILAIAPSRISGAFWWMSLVVVVGANLALIWLCIAVIRRTRHRFQGGRANEPAVSRSRGTGFPSAGETP